MEIKRTPELKGKDAIRFLKRISKNESKMATKKEIEKALKSAMSIGTMNVVVSTGSKNFQCYWEPLFEKSVLTESQAIALLWSLALNGRLGELPAVLYFNKKREKWIKKEGIRVIVSEMLKALEVLKEEGLVFAP